VSTGSALLPVGGQWVLTATTRDLDGELTSADPPTVVITLPDATTAAPAFTAVSTGVWRTVYTLVQAGRYIAHVITTTSAVNFAAYAQAPTAAGAMPDVGDCRDFDPSDLGSWSDAQVQDALDSEASAQRDVCRVGAEYTPALAEALKRRVQVNLAMRPLPLAVLTGDSDAGPVVLPARDPMVRSKEAPYRKRVVG
jgi:hypothetical protein